MKVLARSVFAISALLLFLASAPPTGCMPATSTLYQSGTAESLPRTVAVVGALIGPGMANGTAWDGPGNVDALANQVSEALAATNPYTAAVALMANPTVKGFEPPDTTGRVELYEGLQLVGIQNLYVRVNELAPMWNSPPIQWSNVDITSARLRLVLIDKDLMANDDMGTVDIGPDAFRQAVLHGGRLSFRAAEQTHNQVLFVDIAVY